MVLVHHGLDLFNYDQKLCSHQLLIAAGNTKSNVEYDEYVVYKRTEDNSSPSSPSREPVKDEDSHVTYHFTRDDTSGSVLLDRAFRQGHLVDHKVHIIYIHVIVLVLYKSL